MRFRSVLVPALLLLATRAASGQNSVSLEVTVFQGLRSAAPPAEASPSSVVVLAPDPGWSSDIERERQQLADALGLDGVTVVGSERATISAGSARSLEFARMGGPALSLSVQVERYVGSRVILGIHLREKGIPETELASFAVSGELGKAFVVGARSGAGPLLVSVTPREGGTPLSLEERKTIYKVGGDVRPPTLIKKAEPNYPLSMRKEKKSGSVVLEATIDEQGVVRNLAVLRRSEPEFESAALEAVSQWQYSPATKNGRPVSVIVTITVTFNLR